MPTARSGDIVRVHYTGRLDDGTVFDSSRGRDPLEFALGSGQVIPGFDEAVTGMATGDTKSVRIPSAEAYGEHDEGLLLRMPLDRFPPDMRPSVGQQLQLTQGGADPVAVTVAEVTDDMVVLDANHPLAGRDLTFDLELVDVA